LAQLLSAQVGFYITYDHNYSYIGIRGFSRHTDYNNRILLLIDGHRVNDYFYDQAMLGPEFGFDLQGFERVEIIRGPGSALYGTSAMFAVINLITRNHFEKPSVYASYGSYGNLQTAIHFSPLKTESTTWSVSANLLNSRGHSYRFDELALDSVTGGLMRNRDEEIAYGVLSKFKYRQMTALVGAKSRLKEVPTASFGTIPSGKLETRDDQLFSDIRWSKALRYNLNVSTRVYGDYYVFHGDYPYSDGLEKDRNINVSVGSEVQAVWDVRPNDRLISGIDFNRNFRSDYRVTYGGEKTFDQNFPYTVVSIYLQNEWQIFSSLLLCAGLRRDEYVNRNHAYSPRGAVVYTPVKTHTFKLLYGEAFRNPNNNEQHIDPVDAGEQEAKGLKPERLYSLEGIWNYQLSSSLLSSISLYRFRIKGIIDQVEVMPDSSITTNTDAYKALGAEWELTGSWDNDNSGYLRYSFQQARNENSNRRLTNSPLHLVKAGYSRAFMKFFNGTAEVQYESSRRTLSDARTKNVILLHTGLDYKTGSHIRISLKVLNMLNRRYEHPAGAEHVQDIFLQSRRTFVLSAGYNF
ncbi:MAG TPA: TonB-dependent receptor, partial [bacterium]|nr:TonB-dependent receptor [bacterium]